MEKTKEAQRHIKKNMVVLEIADYDLVKTFLENYSMPFKQSRIIFEALNRAMVREITFSDGT